MFIEMEGAEMVEDCCTANIVHPDKICQAKSNMPDTELIRDMTDLLKVMADETRMRIISALSECELCVCDLAEIVEASQSAVSHQLRILRQARLVKYRKDGRNTFYMLDDEHVETIIRFARDHVQEA
jgi:ArsR family transcriptional regulator